MVAAAIVTEAASARRRFLPIFPCFERVLNLQFWKAAICPSVPDADLNHESLAQDAPRSRRKSRIRSSAHSRTHRSSGPRARFFYLRHGLAHLRLGSLVGLAHQDADDVWPRILRLHRKSWLGSNFGKARRFRQRRNARGLAPVSPMYRGPDDCIP